MRAAFRVLDSSMAIVMGPTPPGTGVIASRLFPDGAVVHVADQPVSAPAFGRVYLVDANVHDDHALFHHVCLEVARLSYGGDYDVRLAGYVCQVSRSGVAHGYRGVRAVRSLHEQVGYRLADDVGTSKHHNVLAGRVKA